MGSGTDDAGSFGPFSADECKAMIREARTAALEQCAVMCEEWAKSNLEVPEVREQALAVELMARKIRELVSRV